MILCLGTALSSNAATMFSSNFNSGTLDSTLTRTYINGGTLTLNSTTAVFNAGRNFVGTVGADYATSLTNWTASIEVQHTNFSSNNLFFGLGTGTASSTSFHEPQGATAGEAANYISMQNVANSRSLVTISKAASGAYFSGQQDFSDAQFNTLLGTTGGVQNGGFYRYYLDFDQALNSLTFSMSTLTAFGGTAGPKTAFRTVSLTGDGYNSTNGRIFFGGEGNSTFDNLSIVPEPSSALLGGLGVLVLLRRRRN